MTDGIVTKKCKQCGEDKTLPNFARDKTQRDQKNPVCRRCYAVKRAAQFGVKPREINYERSDKYYATEKARERNRRNQRIQRAKMTPEQLDAKRQRTADWRAKSPRTALGANRFLALRRRPTDNPVSLDELMELWHSQSGLCAISGLEMTWRKGRVMSTSMSIDRIDRTEGYTVGNVRLVCHAVNCLRGQDTDEQMLEMARAIVTNMESQRKLKVVS